MELLTWMEAWRLSLWVRESYYGYYIMLNLHAIGMALVVGVVLMLNLRVLGFASQLPLGVFDRLLVVGWAGFAVNFASGFVLFAAQGARYIQNPPFIIKILLIVVGGLSMWALGRLIRTSGPHLGVSRPGRVFASVSIVFWVGAIAAGRLIAYTLGPPPPPGIV